jgi:surfactin synthase thioesterase subunit
MLPWAGADPAAMREAWQGMAGWEEDTEVLALQLPGRGT